MEREGLTNFTPVHAGFLTYEHAGEPLDAIIATVTFHHLPDFWKQVALCRFHDMLKPGGLLYLVDVVFDFPPREYRERIDGWFESMRAVAGQHMGNEAVVHIRDEFSTWDWIMTGMLERAGFQVDRNFETLPLMRTYVCSKP
jgi:SAM-dependent methyltransferase